MTESVKDRFLRGLDRISDRMDLVETAMRSEIASDSALLQALGEHVLAAGGKRMRPALVLFAGELCGYQGPRSVQLGAALELLHTATLLHDDVVDLGKLRRGQPSANAIWGNRRAILVGDFFYAHCSNMISADRDFDVLDLFTDTIASMAEGELFQLERSFDPDVAESHYFKVIDGKSARLLSAACEIGAIVGGVNMAQRKLLAQFGRELGVAFQLRDDVIDYTSSEDELGKPPFADLREGKVTLPLLLTLKRCSNNESEEIQSMLKTLKNSADEEGGTAALRDVEDFAPILALVERHHGVEDTAARARQHIAKAMEAIASFPKGEAKDAMQALAEYSVERDQ
ncbi:MAG: polyprenyl synthetase family protein [Deltaproteobacteria bacterium]|nr:polyprenyl synthetase family protein [Deltaproteobacteria bacterium]